MRNRPRQRRSTPDLAATQSRRSQRGHAWAETIHARALPRDQESVAFIGQAKPDEILQCKEGRFHPAGHSGGSRNSVAFN
jgi:hypothetical protein